MLHSDPLAIDDFDRELYDHFVPENHPLRRIDEAIDFSFILPLVAHRYNSEIGRPAESFGGRMAASLRPKLPEARRQPDSS